jgi:hypothetical protein
MPGALGFGFYCVAFPEVPTTLRNLRCCLRSRLFNIAQAAAIHRQNRAFALQLSANVSVVKDNIE